jgi:arginine decarboxylase-like protein
MSRSMRIFGVVWSGLYYQVTTEGMITVCLESNDIHGTCINLRTLIMSIKYKLMIKHIQLPLP